MKRDTFRASIVHANNIYPAKNNTLKAMKICKIKCVLLKGF